MSKECSENCSECSSDCEERVAQQSLLEKPNGASNIKKVIGVVSGKGGVGKSLVTSFLATDMQKKGYNSAILDADITGSIPRMFGIQQGLFNSEEGIIPAKAENGLEIMSINLLLEKDTDPVVWRGTIIAGMAKQLWTDVYWGDNLAAIGDRG